jgi:GMP synthase (glutamine-hydrolysing)
MSNKLKYLLLQVRNQNDPMQTQEIACFARALRCNPERIATWDLLNSVPATRDFDRIDMVLLGGSGHYSAATADAWIDPIMDSLREIHEISKPTFASCWGFQAMSRAMGGRVIKDLERAELGTHWLRLTDAGKSDPLFSPLGEIFGGQMGHEDRVDILPPDAVLLASTDVVENQAYHFRDKPIYCTQFHPELNRDDLMGRVMTYPEYIHRICGMPPERFGELLSDTLETEALLPRFVELVFGA